MDSLDGSGFFIIIVDNLEKKIIVEHYNYVKDSKNLIKTGKINQVLEGTKANELCADILEKGLVTKPDHAAYLGMELQKAELALKNGVEYTQDEELKLR
jgi:tetrahydromethanopterin S-methyltransferase subunit A